MVIFKWNINDGGLSMRIYITYKCSVCNEENYIGTKNKTLNPDRLEIKKYCKRCQKKTVHKEKK
jgi:large subunit ribosomal protein L33